MGALKYRARGMGHTTEFMMKVYLAGHPGGFDKAYDKICEDIFEIIKNGDFAIYCLEDKDTGVSGEELERFLKGMRLFIIPVTSGLLLEGDHEVDVVLSFAERENIPVLPILVEEEVSKLYARNIKFRRLYYIDIYEKKEHGLSYKEKLNKYIVTFLVKLTYADRFSWVNKRSDPAKRLLKVASRMESGFWFEQIMQSCIWMYHYGIGVRKDYKKALELCEKFLPPDNQRHLLDPEILRNVEKEYVSLLYESGYHEEAVEVGEEVYESFCRDLGDEAASACTMGSFLTFLYRISGSYEKSAKLGEKIYGIECRTLGEEDKKTLSTLGLLALTYIESGSWEKGLRLAEKAYGIWSRLYGEEDLSALKLLSYMAEAYDGLGDHGEALRLCGRIKETGAEIPEETKKRINRILFHET